MFVSVLSFVSFHSFFSRHCKLVFVLRYREGDSLPLIAVLLLLLLLPSLTTETLLLLLSFLLLHLIVLLHTYYYYCSTFEICRPNFFVRFASLDANEGKKRNRHTAEGGRVRKQIIVRIILWMYCNEVHSAGRVLTTHNDRVSRGTKRNSAAENIFLIFFFSLHLIGGGISSFDLTKCVDGPTVCCPLRHEYFVLFCALFSSLVCVVFFFFRQHRWPYVAFALFIIFGCGSVSLSPHVTD